MIDPNPNGRSMFAACSEKFRKEIINTFSFQVISGIDPDFIGYRCRFYGQPGFEMNIGYNRNAVSSPVEFLSDLLQVLDLTFSLGG